MTHHPCEDFRELLVELAYGEIEAVDASRLERHLESCAPCAERRRAFQGVRDDLRASENAVPPAPSRVTFVVMPGAAATGVPRSPWTRGLAAAASFVLGFLLIGALVNLELSHDAAGWSLRTSLLPRPAPVSEAEPAATGEPAPASGPVDRVGGTAPRVGIPVSGTNGPFRVMSQSERERLLGLRGASVSETPPTSLRPEQLQPIIDELVRERDARLRSFFQDMLANAESRQREQVESALTGLLQSFDAQRTNDLLFFAGELTQLQQATGLELQQANAAIDYLISLEAQAQAQADAAEPAVPERERRQ